jgi:uncharacterized protein (DUF1697 family)
MQTYISMLRGINVSGRNILKMEALRDMYIKLNFSEIKTYIQSGNVVFNFKSSNTKAIEKLINNQLKNDFELEVPVIVKSAQEIKLISNSNPFLIHRQEDITKLHVTFLSDEPNKNAIEPRQSNINTTDEFIIVSNVVYLFCPNGYGNTKLTNTFFENKLKVTATTRNWKTIMQLVEMSKQLP